MNYAITVTLNKFIFYFEYHPKKLNLFKLFPKKLNFSKK